MTREEQLIYCKKCKNRAFDPKHGIICNLTNKVADFEKECKDFIPDEAIKEVTSGDKDTIVKKPAKLSSQVLMEIKSHQVLSYAVVGGFLLAVICAIIWAFITVTTEYQIGFMAIGVGFVVGMGVRFFGAGLDTVYGFVGAVLSLLGCALGNLFSQVGFIAHAQSLGYIETLSYLDLNTVILIFTESFSPMDVLFYGIAVVEGYKFAFRPITEAMILNNDFVPKHSKLRFPFVIVSLVIVALAIFKLSAGVNGQKTFYYESGVVLSTGNMENSKEEGKWDFYYTNGKIQATGNFKQGLEDGLWKWYAEDGKLMREVNFSKGLSNGNYKVYHDNGSLKDSGTYLNGRLTGKFAIYTDNGNIIQQGDYLNDNPVGTWLYYYENGKKSAECFYDNGKPVGTWKYWYEDNTPTYYLEFDSSEQPMIISSWDRSGNMNVENGTGQFYEYYEDGTLMETGNVKNGYKDGIWKTYYPNGILMEEGVYNDDTYKILNTWDNDGKINVNDGNGKYIIYYEGTNNVLEDGRITDGLRDGYWKTYYNEPGSIQMESTYVSGKLDGLTITYYPEGQKATQGSFINDKKEGRWEWYFESGALESIATFRNDKKEGIQEIWNQANVLLKQETYKNGELISQEIMN